MIASFRLILVPILLACANAYAYPTPPPNDTSIYYVKPHQAPASVHHKKKYVKHAHHRVHHRKYHSTRKIGLNVYFPLAAPACCGGAEFVKHPHGYAYEGVWQKSLYATYNPGPEDFSYSASNDDDTRSWDDYSKDLAEDVNENPDP